MNLDVIRMNLVRRGVVTITKADLVDADMVALVAEEVAELLRASGLPPWPHVAVSSTTGRGLDELRKVLTQTAANVETQANPGVFRLAIDRVF